MKISKIIASVAAAAVAASAMTIGAFAAVTKVEPITLNSKNDSKLVQYDVSCLGTDKVETVQIIGTLPVDTWFGGGGALGFDSVENDWVQVDFELGKSDAYKVDEAGNMDVTLDFTGKDATPNLEKEDGGIAQLGWWWGSGDGTVSITDILVNGVSIMGNEAFVPTPAAEEEGDVAAVVAESDELEDEAVEDGTATAEEVSDFVEEDAAPEVVEETAPEAEPVVMTDAVVVETEAVAETAPATTETSPVKTGNTAAATIAVVMVAAGAAAVVSKRK